MCDIFISYANVDQKRAVILAKALEELGWSVFWDRSIPPGETWVKYIGSELDDAKCVLVLWSKSSIESTWVYEEADRAHRRGVLIPLLIDDVIPPLGFGGVQAAKLIDWKGQTSTPEFQQLVTAIQHLCKESPEKPQPSPHVPPPPTPPWFLKLKVATLAVLVLIALALGGSGIYYLITNLDDDNGELTPIASLLTAAKNAQRDGRLFEPADDSAHYWYHKVLEIDSVHDGAKRGKQQTIQHFADEIRRDLKKTHLEKAQKKIQLLQGAEPTSPLVQTLNRDLEISKLLQQANKDLAAGRLTSPEQQNALLGFRRILEIAPNNKEAQEGIETILYHFIALANDDLQKGNLSHAGQSIAQLEAIDPESPTIPLLSDQLQVKKKQQAIDALVAQIKKNLAKDNLVDAEHNIEQLEYIYPEHPAIRSFRIELAAQKKQRDIAALLTEIKQNLADDDLAVMERNIEQLETVDPENPEIPSLKDQLQARIRQQSAVALVAQIEQDLARGNLTSAEHRIKRLESIDPDNTAIPSLRKKHQTLKIQQQKVKRLLSEANRAFEAGKLLEPEKKNAFYLYHQILGLDGKNASAQSGIKKIEQHFKSVFEKHLSAAEFGHAETIVEKIENAMTDSIFAQELRSTLEANKPSDIEIINEIIGKFKTAFETKNHAALQSMSEFKPNRKEFVNVILTEYRSYRVEISAFNYIKIDRRGEVHIKIIDLITKHGDSMIPPSWSQFPVEIKRNAEGVWKVFW